MVVDTISALFANARFGFRMRILSKSRYDILKHNNYTILLYYIYLYLLYYIILFTNRASINITCNIYEKSRLNDV